MQSSARPPRNLLDLTPLGAKSGSPRVQTDQESSAAESPPPSKPSKLARKPAANIRKRPHNPLPAELTLAIDKRGVGFALAAPAEFGAWLLTALDSTIVGLRFPIDVSGGLARFRHKRSVLHGLNVEGSLTELAADLAPKLLGILGKERPLVSLAGSGKNLDVELIGARHGLDESAEPVLAFRVVIRAQKGGLDFYVHHARGAALPAPAHVLAMRAVAQVLGSNAVRSGAHFHMDELARRVAFAVFPGAGVRAPDSHNVECTGLSIIGERVTAVFERGAEPFAPSELSIIVTEEVTLARAADDAAFQSEMAASRTHLLRALDIAPQHPGILWRLASIDAREDEARAEVGLSWLSEIPRQTPFGTLEGDLELIAKRTADAVAAYVHAADLDGSAVISAAALQSAALACADLPTRIAFLSQSLAKSPGRNSARLWRFRALVASGRMKDARIDVAHLEATCTTLAERRALLLRAGHAWLAHGHAADARTLFERALRGSPDDPDALVGLGLALSAAGSHARAATLLARAIDRAAAAFLPEDEASLALARVLSHDLNDPSAALARLRGIGDLSTHAAAARALEAELRHRLGDVAGMRIAHARLRGIVASTKLAQAAAYLVQSARFEWSLSQDADLVRAHLDVALPYLGPNAEAEAFARAVGSRGVPMPFPALANLTHERSSAADLPDSQPDFEDEAEKSSRSFIPPYFPDEAASVAALQGDDEGAYDTFDPALEARLTHLKRQVEANPSDDDVAIELAELLEQKRDFLELFALVSARIDEASEAGRARWIPLQQRALGHLAAEAEALGRVGEAELYRSMMDSGHHARA